MRKGLPLTFADAELFAREMAGHPLVSAAEARRDGRKLRVHLELTEGAAFFFGAGEGSGIWFDLAARPPRFASQGVERADNLGETLADAAETARIAIARAAAGALTPEQAYAMTGLVHGCGVEAVQRWHGSINQKSPAAWLLRASAAVSDLLIAEAARAKASVGES